MTGADFLVVGGGVAGLSVACQSWPSKGTMAVTPLRITRGSSSISVTWPTPTPATSVIALSGPQGKVPTTMLSSRSRARGSGFMQQTPVTTDSTHPGAQDRHGLSGFAPDDR